MTDGPTAKHRPHRSSSRTRLTPELRREQLLDIARQQFEGEPYDVVTFEGIAERAGVSPGLVHHYFGTKRELFLALVAQAIEGFQRALAAAADGSTPAGRTPRERLRAALVRYLDFVLDRPNGYAFVIGAHGAPDLDVRRAINSAREAVHRAVLTIIEIPDPTPRQDLAMWGWLGFVERATTRWVDRGGGDREALMEMLMEAAGPLLNG